jgi:hypothetical protein
MDVCSHELSRWISCAVIALGASSRIAHAQPVPDYGFEWARIGHAGNRGTLPSETPLRPDIPPIGAVNYEFRLARTEVTVAQWHEFVSAYAPHYNGQFSGLAFTGHGIYEEVVAPGEPRRFSIVPGYEQYTASMSWHYAARYANWLSNGKATTREAFESGAYDTSTFGYNAATGQNSDQDQRSPGAAFWIPSFDEWTKAVYYDPNRYGAGQEGYWPWPNQSTEPPRGGLPSEGGQTSAETPGLLPGLFPVAQYPAMGPNGLFDVSGGRGEWTETWDFGARGARLTRGSFAGVVGASDDMLAWTVYSSFPFAGGLTGLRLASVVPTPSCAVIIVVGVGMLHRRRR